MIGGREAIRPDVPVQDFPGQLIDQHAVSQTFTSLVKGHSSISFGSTLSPRIAGYCGLLQIYVLEEKGIRLASSFCRSSSLD